MQAADSITTTIINFLKDNGQYDQLPAIADALQKEAYRSQKITVISAVPLDKSEEKELTASLTKKWGEHPVEQLVDPLLASGLIIRFKDQVIDMSGRGRLADLSVTLKK